MAGALLVGRQGEMAALSARMAAVAGGTGGLILLGGEAGVGKTTLLTALRQQGSLRTLIGRCLGPDETLPFGPWLDVVRIVAGECGCTTTEMPRPFGESDGEATSADAAFSLARWLDRNAGPVLVVIEDLHWADPSTLELLRLMAPRLADLRLLLLVTYRTDELHRTHPLWTLLPQLQRSGAERRVLNRLTVDDLTALVQASLPDLPGAASWPERLHRRTGGHPLFVRELLDEAVRSGRVPQEDEPLPETLQQAIDSRLSRLSATTQTVLEAAAVIGERFPYEILERISGLGEEELAAALEEALALHILRAESGEQITFDHALVREALAARLVPPRRRRWHARIAEVLLAAPRPDIDAIALHLTRAGDPRAVHYLMMAGDRLLRLGALVQASQVYERALELMPEADSRRPELLLKLGHTVRYRPDRRAVAFWEEALTAARAASDQAVALWAESQMLVVDSEQSGTWLERAIDLERRQEAFLQDDRHLALERDLFGENAGYPRVAAVIAQNLLFALRLDEARAKIESLKARANPEFSQYPIQYTEMQLATVTGQMQRWMELSPLLIEAQRRIRYYANAAAFSFTRLGMALRFWADRPDEVDALGRAVLQCQAEAKERSGATVAEGFDHIGPLQLLRGDWQGAQRNLIEALQQHPDLVSITMRASAAALLAARGDYDGALTIMAPYKPERPDAPFDLKTTGVAGHSVRILLYLAKGDLNQARVWLESAERWESVYSLPLTQALYRTARSAFAEHTGDRTSALHEAKIALTAAEELGDLLEQIRAYRLVGRLLAGSDPTAAAHHLTTSATLAERCRYPYELALTQLELGRAFPADPGARAGLTAARAILARLQASVALAQAEQLLQVPPQAAPNAVAPLPLPGGLTEREAAVIRLVARGLTDKEVAARLFISPRTVDGHLRNIFNKLNVSNRAALTAYAVQHGLTG